MALYLRSEWGFILVLKIVERVVILEELDLRRYI